jgi:predicted adenine nucleotide alpha hydrolase (AANH) superfamily ATPase
MDALKKFAEEKKLPLLTEDEYGLRAFIYGDWYQNLTHRRLLENSSRQGEEDVRRKRCAFCYKLRLEKTARLAAEKGYDAFSTTLLISPYQNHDLIRQTGVELASVYGIEFLYRDFRPLFRQGREQARAAGYYMQKYCGCIFSEEERYLGGGE